RVLEVDIRAVEIGNTHLVDDHLDTVEVDGHIAVEHPLVEVELVDEAGATAGLYCDAQAEVVTTLLAEEAANLLGGGVCEPDAVGRGNNRLCHVLILRATVELCEQNGFGEDSPGENSQVERLIRAVRTRV